MCIYLDLCIYIMEEESSQVENLSHIQLLVASMQYIQFAKSRSWLGAPASLNSPHQLTNKDVNNNRGIMSQA
jgi:hypothetical protein